MADNSLKRKHEVEDDGERSVKRERVAEPAPGFPMARSPHDNCAICRRPLGATCMECYHSGEDRVCFGVIHNAVCSHSFHRECIRRWLCVRPRCPLCNSSWIFPAGLSLRQLAAAKFADHEATLVKLVAEGLSPDVYSGMNSGVRMWQPSRDVLVTEERRLLACAFGQYLTVEELESLVAYKKRLQGKDDKCA